MATVDEILAQAEMELVQPMLTAASSTPATEPTGYGLRQFAFDLPMGVAKAGAGLADVLSYPVVKGLEYAGAPVETFGLSKLLGAGAEAAAPTLGVSPDTAMQEAVSFLTPSPLSKAKLLSQAGTGLAAYLGSEAAQSIAPESQYAGLVGALAGPAAVSKAAKAASSIAPSLEEAGLSLQRGTMGIRKADLTAAKNAILKTEAGLDLPESLPTTQVTKSFNNLIENNVLGQSRDPATLLNNAEEATAQIEKQIQGALKAVDASDTKITMPAFRNAQKYLDENKVDITNINEYQNIINDFKTAVKNESKFIEPQVPTLYDEFGTPLSKSESPTMRKALEDWQAEQIKRSKLSLDVLNKQRKVFGEKYKQGPQASPGFWRAFYRDIKEHIEQYAPEVKQLNKQKQDLVVARPILEQAKKAAEAPLSMANLRRGLLYTTGGFGLPGAAVLTGSTGLGGALALGLGLGSTKTGQNLIGRGLRQAGSLAEGLQPSLDLGQLATRGALTASQQELPTMSQPAPADMGYLRNKADQELTLETTAQSVDDILAAAEAELGNPIQPTPTSESVKVGKQNISIPTGDKYAPASLVKAVMRVESAGKANAVSPKGASGLMQLMPGTAKSLGVDPTDPQQNVEGGSRYLRELLDKYNSEELALAAYNWGPGNMDRAIRKVKAAGVKTTWANLLKEVKVPKETRQYVPRVLSYLA
jgi:soluble lytic murein transglycosylase-like protein